jgi:hypothetical protein
VGTLIRVAVVTAVIVAAGAAVLLIGHDVPSAHSGATAATTVRTSFEPPAVQFGDPLTLHIAARFDNRVVLPDTFRLTSSVVPLTQLGPVRTKRTSRGHLTVVSVSIPVACIAPACVARPGETRIHLPVVAGHVTGVDGRVRSVTATWPPLLVGSRVSSADLAHAAPPLRADTSPVPPTFRISPRRLALMLDVLAVVLAASGAWLASRQMIAILRSRRETTESDQLTTALRRVRQSETRPAPDRRRALGHLARVLDRRGLDQAQATNDLAWSRPAPTPEGVADLAGRIESETKS